MKTYFKQPINIISCTISLAVGMVALLFKSTPIPMWILAVSVIPLLIIIWIMYARIDNIETDIKEHSALIFDINQFMQISGNDLILLGKNNILHLDVLVDIYYTEKKFEQRIAFGYLVNIQRNNEMQQIKIVQWYIQDQMKEEIMHNNINYINKITIKPIFKTYGGYENG